MSSRMLEKSLFSPARPRRAGVGRVRRLDFLSILRGCVLLSQTCGALDSRRASIVFPQPALLRVGHV